MICHILKDWKEGIFHIETEASYIGKVSGSIFSKNSGGTDADKYNMLGVLQKPEGIVNALLKISGVHSGYKALKGGFNRVIQKNLLIFQIFLVAQAEFTVALAAQLFAEAENRGCGNMGFVCQLFDLHMGNTLFVAGDAVVDRKLQFVEVSKQFRCEHSCPPVYKTEMIQL